MTSDFHCLVEAVVKHLVLILVHCKNLAWTKGVCASLGKH